MKGFLDIGGIPLRSWQRRVPFWKWLIFCVSCICVWWHLRLLCEFVLESVLRLSTLQFLQAVETNYCCSCKVDCLSFCEDPFQVSFDQQGHMHVYIWVCLYWPCISSSRMKSYSFDYFSLSRHVLSLFSSSSSSTLIHAFDSDVSVWESTSWRSVGRVGICRFTAFSCSTGTIGMVVSFFFCTNVLTESADTIYFSILGLVIHICMFLILTTIPY